VPWSDARRHGCSAPKRCGTRRTLTETRSTMRKSGRGGGAAAGGRRRRAASGEGRRKGVGENLQLQAYGVQRRGQSNLSFSFVAGLAWARPSAFHFISSLSRGCCVEARFVERPLYFWKENPRTAQLGDEK